MIYINIATEEEYLVKPFSAIGLPGLVKIIHIRKKNSLRTEKQRVIRQEELDDELYMFPENVKYPIFGDK